MTSFLALANFEGERFPSKLVFGEATQVFHGDSMDFIFLGLIYKESHGSFCCNTFSQSTFPVFLAYSCSWRDCPLGEILISLGKIIMLHYFMFIFKFFLFQFQKTLRSKCQNISCKNVKQWRNSVVFPLSCCESIWCWWIQMYK